MRPDMHKVVVERPRTGGDYHKKKRLANRDPDLLPRGEGIRRPYWSRKCFSDLLGPLRRWLRSQVGRPWNKVYSEASAVIVADSVVRAHIRTHLFEMVERHTLLQDGVICSIERDWPRRGMIPVTEHRTRRNPFYVHPVTGLLCEGAPKRRRPAWASKEERMRATCRWRGVSEALVRVRGLWFHCTMKSFPQRSPPGTPPLLYDINLRKSIGRWEAETHYGRSAVCTAKRQLSARDLRRFGLSNEPAAMDAD